MLYHDPAAKTHDRIGFTLSIAIAMHIAVILGVGFIMQIPNTPSATRMDITLSNYATDQVVLDADFVAQTNQEASGSESNKAELTTTEIAPINDPLINPIQTVIEIPNLQSKTQKLQVVTTVSKNHTKDNKAQPDPEKDNQDDLKGNQEKLQRQLEMASLQAKLDEEQQIYARLPRIRRASSVATKAADDAEYLYNWQQRIEKIGNSHYPEQAKKQKIDGDVRVLVAIKSDGSLQKVEILESSGIPLLDSTTLKIVRLASPFAPFPANIKKNTDILEVVRTWQFRQNKFSNLNQ